MKKRIISASRRTDLVACYPEELTQILLGKKTGPQSHIRPKDIHTLVLWTKDFRPLLRSPLREVAADCDQVICHLTVTGLGGTHLEPCVPNAKELLSELPALLKFLGDPRRLIWRYDPIIKHRGIGNDNIDCFDALASIFSGNQVTDLRTSWVTIYPKVLRRLPGLKLPSETKRLAFIDRLEARAKDWGLSLSTCCVPNRPVSKCIDAEYFSLLHPRGEIIKAGKAQQREGCGCDKSWDVGWYQHRCHHGCLYCYA